MPIAETRCGHLVHGRRAPRPWCQPRFCFVRVSRNGRRDNLGSYFVLLCFTHEHRVPAGTKNFTRKNRTLDHSFKDVQRTK